TRLQPRENFDGQKPEPKTILCDERPSIQIFRLAFSNESTALSIRTPRNFKSINVLAAVLSRPISESATTMCETCCSRTHLSRSSYPTTRILPGPSDRTISL